MSAFAAFAMQLGAKVREKLTDVYARLERLEAFTKQIPDAFDQIGRELTLVRIMATDPSVDRRLKELDDRIDLLHSLHHALALEMQDHCYKGVWNPDDVYRKHNSATLGGSVWIALEDDPGKPGESRAWQLAVKRGENGRDARRSR